DSELSGRSSGRGLVLREFSVQVDACQKIAGIFQANLSCGFFYGQPTRSYCAARLESDTNPVQAKVQIRVGNPLMTWTYMLPFGNSAVKFHQRITASKVRTGRKMGAKPVQFPRCSWRHVRKNMIQKQ